MLLTDSEQPSVNHSPLPPGLHFLFQGLVNNSPLWTDADEMSTHFQMSPFTKHCYHHDEAATARHCHCRIVQKILPAIATAGSQCRSAGISIGAGQSRLWSPGSTQGHMRAHEAEHIQISCPQPGLVQETRSFLAISARDGML